MPTQNFLPSSSGENSLGASDLKFSDGYFNSGAFQSGVIAEAFYLRGKLYPHNFLTIDGLVEESSDINVEKYLNFPKWKSGINEGGTLSAENIYRNENVGIGTDDPSERLHVQGNSSITGDVTVKNFMFLSSLNSEDFSLSNEDLIEKTNDASASIYRESPTTSLVKNDGLNLVRLSSFHPLVVSEFSSSNNGRSYIQNIDLDRYGHVTGLSSSRESFIDTQVRKERVEDLIFNRIKDGDEILLRNTSKGKLEISSEHPFIGSCGDSFNQQRTYLQNLFFDEFGHVQALNSSSEDFLSDDVINKIVAHGEMNSTLVNGEITLSSSHLNVNAPADSSNPPRTYINELTIDEFGHLENYSSSSETLTTGDVTDAILSLNPAGENINMSKVTESNSILISSSHQPISAPQDSINSGRKYIRSISLDDYGHITSLSTHTETFEPRTDSEIINYVSDSALQEGSNITLSEVSSSPLNGPLDDTGSFPNNKTIHLQHTNPNVSTFTNYGNGGVLKFQNVTFDNNNPLFGQGSLKMGQTSFGAIDWRDAQFAQNEDFTVDFWFYKDQNVAGKHEAVLGNNAAGTASEANWRILYNHDDDEGMKFIHNSNSQLLNSGPVPLGQWNHLAIERFNNNLYMYLNGVIVSTENNISKAINGFGVSGGSAWSPLGYSSEASFRVDFPSSITDLGFFPGGSTSYTGFDGYIQDFRIIKGQAAYNATNFNPQLIISSTHSTKEPSKFLQISNFVSQPVGANNLGPNTFIQNLSFDSHGHIESIFYRERTTDAEILEAFSESLDEGTVQTSINSDKDELEMYAVEKLPDIKPPGFVYLTVDNDFNPNDSFPGSWSLFGAGQTLVGVGEGYSAGTTGGSKTHTLTANEMPIHNHGNTPIMGTDIDAAGGGLIMHLNSSVKESYDPSNPTIWKDLTGNGNHMTLNSVESSNDDLVYNLFFTIGESRASVTFTGINLDSVTTIRFEQLGSGSSRWNLSGSQLVLLYINLNTLLDFSNSNPDGLKSYHSLQYGRGLESFDFGQGPVNLSNNNLGLEFEKVYSSGLNFDNLNANGTTGETKSIHGQNWSPEDQHCMDMWVRFNPVKFRITIHTMNSTFPINNKGTDQSGLGVQIRLKIGRQFTNYQTFFHTADYSEVIHKDFTSYHQIPSEVHIRNFDNDGYGFWKLTITLYDSLSATSGNTHILAEHLNGPTGQAFGRSRFFVDGNQDAGTPKESIFKLNGAGLVSKLNPDTFGVESFTSDTPMVSRWWLGTFGGHQTGAIHYLKNQFGLWGMGHQYAFGLGEDGDWHHIAVQIDHFGHMKWFLDGALEHTRTDSPGHFSFTNKILDINPSVDYGQGNPDVNISSIRLWNNGLSENAITFLYNLDRDISLLENNPWRGLYDTRSAGQTISTGGGQPHNNLQPYTVIKMWKRDS